MKLIRRAGQQPKALSHYSQGDAGDGCTVMLDFHASEELQSTAYIRNIPRGLFSRFLGAVLLASILESTDAVILTMLPRYE